MGNRVWWKTLVLIAIFILPACGADLHGANLTNAILDVNYNFHLFAEDDSWSLYDNSYLFFVQSRGHLPGGVFVEPNGTIYGVPTEVGNFEFRVTVYVFESYDLWDLFFYDSYYDDYTSADSEWYTLFVTESSTNSDCPSPANETTKETFVCLGSPEVETLAEDENFDLDINFFVDFQKSKEYAINVIDITIHYDDALFKIDSNFLNSQILREAATRINSTVSFDDDTPGELRIIVTGHDSNFHKSGRLMDLHFTTLQDIAAGDYDFTLTINNISSVSNNSLPTTVAVDGMLTVEEDIDP